ncbi:MAG: tetratricopeptide repeat protein [Kofleriaceae bacterium]
MVRPRLLLAVATLSVCVAHAAHADLATGRDRLTAGAYPEAQRLLAEVTGSERGAARLLLARAQRETGAYATAEATARALLTDKDPAIAIGAALELARVMRLTGRGADARRDLEALVAKHPDDRAIRHAAIDALRARGAIKEADALVERTIDEFDARAIDLDDPDQLYYLGDAARVADELELANQSFQEALNLRPQHLDAGVAWADLFLSKYAAGEADGVIEDLLKVNPNHAEANALRAAVIVESSYDLERARLHLAAALETNPSSARALAVRASIEIDRNEWAAATASVDAILAINPEDTTALALKATVAWLRDDHAGYEALRTRALSIDPAFSGFYAIVGRSAVREHRYVEAVELGKQAVALVPTDYAAMGDVGLGYLRLGQEQEGRAWLDRAWKGDEYNVRVYNTRSLYRDVIGKDYVFYDTKHFRFRYHKDEERLLARYISPAMERAFVDMTKRYGFTPKTPIIMEVYADADAYGIRTVGLPNLGALGVCFGQVVTAMSPTTGNLNWGMVLWHELSHVFAIQASNSRVPRWFTEGLSEYETLIARPEWRRENDADLYGAVREGKLPSVAALNYEFMQPDQNAVIVAYYLSAVTIEYLAATYGFPKIVEALRLFGQGKETPEVIATITGRDVATFDREFRAYLDVRLAPYAGTFHLPAAPDDDVTALEIAAAAKPKDATARVRLALGRYAAGDADGAQAELEASLAIDPSEASARYLLAELTLRRGDPAKAEAQYRALVASGVDNFDIRVRLASLAERAGRTDEYVAQLCAAKRLDPERSYPYQELAAHYAKVGDVDRQLVELAHYAMLEQMELEPVKTLTLTHVQRGEWAKARTYGELALYIAPFDADVLLALGRAYQELGAASDALYTFDTALLVKPPLRRPALAHLGRAKALAALGKKADAKAALAAALKTEPENADALELKRRLP